MADEYLSDFVKKFTAKLHYEGVKMPFENEKPWHELFYDFKSVREKPPFIEKLRFDWDGPYPRSRELSDFLHALHWNATVSACNPSFDEISLSEEIADLWVKKVSDLDLADEVFLKIALIKAKTKFKSLKG